MIAIQEINPIPAFATINDWCKLSGMGRTNTYYALGRGDLRSHKLGKRILIDVEQGLAWVRQLPPAAIKPYKRKA